MSTPPPGDQPHGDWPPPGGIPPGQPPPPGYPGYYYGPPPPRRISVAMVFVGPLIYIVANMVIGFMAFILASSSTSQASNVVMGVSAAVLALIAFGGGAGLLMLRSPHAKGIGLGLMIGWALTSVFTVGFCTGINPELYTL